MDDDAATREEDALLVQCGDESNDPPRPRCDSASPAPRSGDRQDRLVAQAGKWRAWEENLQSEKLLAPDLAERKKFLENAVAFADPIRAHAAWATPVGFDVRPERMIQGDNLHEVPPHPIPGGLMFQTFWYYRSAGKVLQFDESDATFMVWFNTLGFLVGQRDIKLATNDKGTMIFAPTRGETKTGIPKYPADTFSASEPRR